MTHNHMVCVFPSLWHDTLTRSPVHRFGPTSQPHNRTTKALNPRMHPTNPKQRGPGETSNQNWDAFVYWETLNMYGKHNLQHLLFQWILPNPSNNVKNRVEIIQHPPTYNDLLLHVGANTLG